MHIASKVVIAHTFKWFLERSKCCSETAKESPAVLKREDGCLINLCQDCSPHIETIIKV